MCRRVVFRCQQSAPNVVPQLQVVLPSASPDCSRFPEWERYYGTGDHAMTYARKYT